jgi:trigger factor
MESDMEKVLSGDEDLAYEMNVDVMPEFEPVDVKKLTIKKPVAEIGDAEIDERLTQIAEANPKYEKRAKTAKARDKDAVVIDFLGKLDGEPFEGGAAEEHTLVLGSNSFIPGFEDQLIGAKAGEEKDVKVTFPENYQAEHLAGKEAVFEVKVHEVRAAKTPDIDDEFAKGLGLEDLAKLKELITEQIQNEFGGASRAKAKRNLLDQLDDKHDFDLPPKMVDQEFGQIWQQLQAEMDAGRTADEDKDKTEDQLKEEYRKIAERRVRLGLVLAEIGRLAEVQISEQEVQQALIREARNFPGQERQVIEFFQKDPNAMAQLRAPIYEDKVVDHILETAKVKEETVAKEDLLKEDEE